MDVRDRFAENLTRRRRRAGMTQRELAARASIHRTQVSLLERGERTPRIDTLVKVARSLGIPPADLLEGMDWEPGNGGPGRFKVAAAEKPKPL